MRYGPSQLVYQSMFHRRCGTNRSALMMSRTSIHSRRLRRVDVRGAGRGPMYPEDEQGAAGNPKQPPLHSAPRRGLWAERLVGWVERWNRARQMTIGRIMHNAGPACQATVVAGLSGLCPLAELICQIHGRLKTIAFRAGAMYTDQRRSVGCFGYAARACTSWLEENMHASYNSPFSTRLGRGLLTMLVLVGLSLGLGPGRVLAAGPVFDGTPGTDAPPATLGPYTMLPFDADPRDTGEMVTTVAGPTGRRGVFQGGIARAHWRRMGYLEPRLCRGCILFRVSSGGCSGGHRRAQRF